MKTGWLTLAALVAWTAALVLSGCAPLDEEPPGAPPDLTPIDGQDQFARVAWEALGQHGTPPLVVWHREGCTDGDPDSYLDPNDECVWGHYDPGFDFVNVAVRGKRPGDTSLAHEYQHLIDWRDRRVNDQAHAGAAFQEGGAVDVARMAMMAAGW